MNESIDTIKDSVSINDDGMGNYLIKGKFDNASQYTQNRISRIYNGALQTANITHSEPLKRYLNENKYRYTDFAERNQRTQNYLKETIGLFETLGDNAVAISVVNNLIGSPSLFYSLDAPEAELNYVILLPNIGLPDIAREECAHLLTIGQIANSDMYDNMMHNGLRREMLMVEDTDHVLLLLDEIFTLAAIKKGEDFIKEISQQALNSIGTLNLDQNSLAPSGLTLNANFQNIHISEELVEDRFEGLKSRFTGRYAEQNWINIVWQLGFLRFGTYSEIDTKGHATHYSAQHLIQRLFVNSTFENAVTEAQKLLEDPTIRNFMLTMYKKTSLNNLPHDLNPMIYEQFINSKVKNGVVEEYLQPSLINFYLLKHLVK